MGKSMKRYAPCIPEEAVPGSMCERTDGEYYLAAEVDARITVLERALHQIKNGCVDDDDKVNEWYRSAPSELRKIAIDALNGTCP